MGNNQGTLSDTDIVAIVLGVVAGLVLIIAVVALLVFCFNLRRHNHTKVLRYHTRKPPEYRGTPRVIFDGYPNDGYNADQYPASRPTTLVKSPTMDMVPVSRLQQNQTAVPVPPADHDTTYYYSWWDPRSWWYYWNSRAEATSPQTSPYTDTFPGEYPNFVRY